MLLELNPGKNKKIYDELNIIPFYGREITKLIKPTDYAIFSGKSFKELESASKYSNALILNPISFQTFYKEKTLIQIFKNNNSYIELPLQYLINSGSYLSLNLNKITQFYLEAHRKKLGIIVTCKSEHDWEVKTERERKSILIALGFNEKEAKEILEINPKKFLSENNNSNDILKQLKLIK